MSDHIMKGLRDWVASISVPDRAPKSDPVIEGGVIMHGVSGPAFMRAVETSHGIELLSDFSDRVARFQRDGTNKSREPLVLLIPEPFVEALGDRMPSNAIIVRAVGEDTE